MFYYTKYAEQKFDTLNRHKVFFTREQIGNVIGSPEKIQNKDKYISAEKEGIKVIYLQENEVIKIITFYPTKE